MRILMWPIHLFMGVLGGIIFASFLRASISVFYIYSSIFVLLSLGSFYLGFKKKPYFKKLAVLLLMAGLTIYTQIQDIRSMPDNYQAGIDALQSEDWDDAIEKLESIHRLEPDYEKVDSLLQYAEAKHQGLLDRAAEEKAEIERVERQRRTEKQQENINNALDAVIGVMDNINKESKLQFFLFARILEGGAKLEITVSDSWYSMPGFQKERMIGQFADAYAGIAATQGLRGEKADESNYPTTSFIDSHGKEVAYKSTFRTKVLK